MLLFVTGKMNKMNETKSGICCASLRTEQILASPVDRDPRHCRLHLPTLKSYSSLIYIINIGMDNIEIAKVLKDWAAALSPSEQFKTRRTSLRDLVQKYSRDARPEESKRGDVHSVFVTVATDEHCIADALIFSITGIAFALKRSVRPWSQEDFTARLLTFQKSTAWFAKPPLISALQCARYGWCNGGIDQIYCLTCGAKLSHTKGMINLFLLT